METKKKLNLLKWVGFIIPTLLIVIELVHPMAKLVSLLMGYPLMRISGFVVVCIWIVSMYSLLKTYLGSYFNNL